MFRDCKKRRVIEESYTPYRNSWFLVGKKDNNYRLINSAIKFNIVMIRDIMIPSSIDKYIADLAIG